MDLMFVVLYSIGNGHVLQFQIVKEASIAVVIVRLNFWCHWSVLYKAAVLSSYINSKQDTKFV